MRLIGIVFRGAVFWMHGPKLSIKDDTGSKSEEGTDSGVNAWVDLCRSHPWLPTDWCNLCPSWYISHATRTRTFPSQIFSLDECKIHVQELTKEILALCGILSTTEVASLVISMTVPGADFLSMMYILAGIIWTAVGEPTCVCYNVVWTLFLLVMDCERVM